MFNSEKRRAKKIRKLEDRISDLKHAKDTWGFSWSPSRHRAACSDGLDPPSAEACSAADWAVDARREIAAAHGEGRLPILAGGTGLYIRTLLDGIAPDRPAYAELLDRLIELVKRQDVSLRALLNAAGVGSGKGREGRRPT